MSPRANWFFGLPVDGAFTARLPEPPQGFRRFHRDDLHITVAFLGGCEEPAAMLALQTLDSLLATTRRSAIAATLADVVPMGPPDRYSALSALLDHGRAETEALIADLRTPLYAAAGAIADTRPAKAHLTIARPQRSATRAERRSGLAWAAALELHGTPITLDRIALYTWSRDRSERLFEIKATRPLI